MYIYLLLLSYIVNNFTLKIKDRLNNLPLILTSERKNASISQICNLLVPLTN